MASFLGTALVERGLISTEQLENALDIQQHTNPLLGELAIEQGLLDQQQVEDINIVQRLVNQRFGDIALEEQLLSAQQVHQLLDLQQQRRRRLGDILIDQGYISRETLQTTLRSLKQQAESNLLLEQLNGTQQCVLHSIEALFNRVLQCHCKHTHAVDITQNLIEQQHIMTLTIVAETSPREAFLRLSIACEQATLVNLASSFMGISAEECEPELALDALGELLNMTAGYIISDPTTTVSDLEPTPAIEPSTLEELHLDTTDKLIAIAFDSRIGKGITVIAEA